MRGSRQAEEEAMRRRARTIVVDARGAEGGNGSREEGKKRGGSPEENTREKIRGRLLREEERQGRERESEQGTSPGLKACQGAVEEDCIKEEAVHRHGSLDRATKAVASKYRVLAA